MGIVICSFDQRSGWRVHRREAAGDPRIRVVVEGGRKYLSIPCLHFQRAGRFCNPAKLAVQWVALCGYPGSINQSKDQNEKERKNESVKKEIAGTGYSRSHGDAHQGAGCADGCEVT